MRKYGFTKCVIMLDFHKSGCICAFITKTFKLKLVTNNHKMALVKYTYIIPTI